MKKAGLVFLILAIVTSLFVLVMELDTKTFTFSNYDQFASVKSTTPATLGNKQGNLGEVLPLELVPACAKDIVYKFDLDTNIATLKFKCEGLERSELENYIQAGNLTSDGYTWEIKEAQDKMYNLTATPLKR